MNIFESTPIMTAIDLVIVACALVVIFEVRRIGRRLHGVDFAGLVAVTGGFAVIGAFFALDLVTMWALPALIGAERAHAWMLDLHINWSWLVMLGAALALTAGIIKTARGVLRAQRKLQEQDELYRSVVEEQSEYIVRWLPDGTRTFVNEAYCRYRRATAEELVGENFFSLIAEADLERVARKAELLTPEHPTFTDSHRSLAPDGSLRWQEWSDRGLFDEAGRLVEVQSVGRDITDRRRIEEVLEAREQQYEAIFRASATGLTVRRLSDGKLLRANPAAAAMFGYTVEEFLELSPSDYVPAELLGLYDEMLAAVGRGERFPFKVKGTHRDGHRIDVEGQFIPFVSEGHERVLGLIEDVTERDRAQSALRESETRFRTLFEAAPNAILVTDLHNAIVDVNPAACRLHGVRREELLGRRLSELLVDEEGAAPFGSVDGAVRAQAIRADVMSSGPTGLRIPISVGVSRFDNAGEPALLYSVTDITQLRRLEEQLRQSQKMEAVGQLAGGVAHDFNNLLTAILGCAELVERDLEANHAVREDVGEIRRAGEKAAALVGQLLAFSRQQVLKPRVLDLNEVVVEMAKLCQRTIGENIKISTRLDPVLGRIKADKSQLEQVILNLALNARDAMPGGGELTFATRNVVLEQEDTAHKVVVPPGAYVSLLVSDTGSGMSEEVRRRVFEPFFTTKGPDQGTGLGLSMVYGIVKQSDGFIWVRSEPARGSTFEILLRQTDEAVRARVEPAAAELARGARSILLVDDNAQVRRVAQRILESEGLEVVAASSAEEALEILESRGLEVELLLVDLVLPGMDGRELIRRVFDRQPDVRAILMSGYSRDLSAESDGEGWGIRMLRKPFSRGDLLEAISSAMGAAARTPAPAERAEPV